MPAPPWLSAPKGRAKDAKHRAPGHPGDAAVGAYLLCIDTHSGRTSPSSVSSAEHRKLSCRWHCSEPQRAARTAPRLYPGPNNCLACARPRLKHTGTDKSHHHDRRRRPGHEAAAANGHEIRLPRGRHGVGRFRRTPKTPASQDGLVQRRTSWVSSIGFTREPRVVRGPGCSIP